MLSPSLLSFLLSKLKFTTGRGWWLTALIWIVTIAPASAALDLRVLIKQGVGQVNVGSSTNAAIKDSSGRSLGVIQGMNGFAAQASGGGVAINNWRSGGLWIEPTGDGVVWIGDRWYRGRAYLAPAKQGLTVVNYVDLEQYLYSVLGGEMNGNWPQEALKAQAVSPVLMRFTNAKIQPTPSMTWATPQSGRFIAACRMSRAALRWR